MDFRNYIKRVQRALKYKYHITTSVTTYEYFNDKYNKFTSTFRLFVNGKMVLTSRSSRKIFEYLKDMFDAEEAKRNGD